MDDTAMDDGIVPDRHIIAYRNARFLICSMDDHPVLDVHLITHANAVHISSDDGIEPNAAIVADLYITYYRSIRCDKTILSEPGGLPFYW
jgi:hypothetical protein